MVVYILGMALWGLIRALFAAFDYARKLVHL
jgi:hypothetical protein